MKIPAVGDETGLETNEEENKGLETGEKPAAAALVKEVESYQQAGLAVVTLDLTGLPGKSPDIHLGLQLNKADSLLTNFFTSEQRWDNILKNIEKPIYWLYRY